MQYFYKAYETGSHITYIQIIPFGAGIHHYVEGNQNTWRLPWWSDWVTQWSSHILGSQWWETNMLRWHQTKIH